jgi:nanoRNase/pAp phosphatase (c-di-AMP/oligoRNAs hydrolase)
LKGKMGIRGQGKASYAAPVPDATGRVHATRSPADLAAIAAALTGAGASAAEVNADPMLASREQVWELERRLRQHKRELAVARARVAELEAAAARDY